MSWYLSAAATTLRNQVDKAWPNRDKASDGSVGDLSHQARPSDHNPDYSDGGVVRAIDLDTNLAKGDPDAMFRLVDQLRRYCKDGKDNGRVSYIIFDGKITSGTYQSSFWTWRTYTGSDPHTGHSHISFTSKGDSRDGEFNLKIFTADTRRQRRRLTKAIDDLKAQIRARRVKLEAKRRQLKKL